MSEQQLVLFKLANEQYAISITQVKEIIQYNGATKLPNAPACMEGIIRLRGKIIPVVDLAKRLDLVDAAKGIDKKALIVETASQEIGIVVDEVTEVLLIPDSAIEPPPVMSNHSSCIRGIGKSNERLLILLDIGNLFGCEEIEEFKKVY